MDKITLRIIGRIGMLIVFIGFFMPISCNLNGFQIAEYSTSMGGMNPLSIGLYGIFIFSCIGTILLLPLVMKKKISMGWDWFTLLGVIISAVVVFIRMDGGNTGFGTNMFQSGAYVILAGMIVSLLFTLISSSKRDEEPVIDKQKENRDE